MTINVTKYRLNPDRVFAGTRGSYGIEKLSFAFGDGWDFDTLFVTFHPQRKKPIRVPILPGAEIDIPAEVMAYSGETRFVVSGVILGDGGEVERKAITLEGFVDVAYTADDKGGNARKMTADVYDQLIDQATGIFNEAREDVERSAGEAAESASNAGKFANDAENSAESAEESAGKAVSAAGAAQSGASAAERAATEAQVSERAAKISEENAAGNAASAGRFASAASDAAAKAVEAKNDAVKAKIDAESAKEETRRLAESAEQMVKDTLQEAKDSGEFDGPAGDTPYIGENGNWWIGETDTGVASGGGLSPVDKTDAMTAEVGRDEQGRLWAKESKKGVKSFGFGVSYHPDPSRPQGRYLGVGLEDGTTALVLIQDLARELEIDKIIGLPEHTDADEGKVLAVMDGAPVWSDAPAGGSVDVSYNETTGDLTITSSSGGVVFDETTGNLEIGG